MAPQRIHIIDILGFAVDCRHKCGAAFQHDAGLMNFGQSVARQDRNDHRAAQI
ncbi:hypothetical protein [Vreelandella profundi]|uniref:hypothetical protein n=1 Tax=Vreelandella profundi TaxID=2852117 RepID=UPI001EF07E4C|nr:hypothetical protein [Halomonas profundi]